MNDKTQKILDAIDAMHSDVSVPPEDTLAELEAIKSHIAILIDGIEADLEEDTQIG